MTVNVVNVDEDGKRVGVRAVCDTCHWKDQVRRYDTWASPEGLAWHAADLHEVGHLAPGEGAPFVTPPPGKDYSTVDQARLAMVAELHTAIYGDTWARPESPAVVWRELLDRVTAARQAFLR